MRGYQCVSRLDGRQARTFISGKSVLFFLSEWALRSDDGRFVYMLLQAFSRAGYSVGVWADGSMSFADYRDLGYCARMGLHLKGVRLFSSMPEAVENGILLTDKKQLPRQALNWSFKKRVFLNFLQPKEMNEGNLLQIPYSMHPRIEQGATGARLSELRAGSRHARVFFAGNTHQDYYDSAAIKTQGVLSRLESLQVLRDRCEPVIWVKSERELERLMNQGGYQPGCIVAETGSFGIPPSRWLDTLSKADFFLCFSGTDYPVCHNAVEAMAVGCVPIIGYADWFSPALEDGENALVFSSAAELKKKFNEALAMPESRVREMRRKAADYYDRHLAPAHFVRRFEALPEGPATLVLFPKFRVSS